MESSSLPTRAQEVAEPFLKLDARAVHVWTVSSVASSDISASFERILARDEKERADRFRSERLRQAFIVVRGALRVLLGRYLGIPPATVEFAYGSRGKPMLAGAKALEFNTSHSGSLAVFAFTAGCEIGVDLEQIRPIPEMQSIANRFFSSDEALELMHLPREQHEQSFFLCWTRKEAYLKATSEGLSAPLDSVRVTLRPGEAARIIRLEGDPGPWSLHDLSLAPNYAAAIAYKDFERPVSILGKRDAGDLLAGSRR